MAEYAKSYIEQIIKSFKILFENNIHIKNSQGVEKSINVFEEGEDIDITTKQMPYILIEQPELEFNPLRIGETFVYKDLENGKIRRRMFYEPFDVQVAFHSVCRYPFQDSFVLERFIYLSQIRQIDVWFKKDDGDVDHYDRLILLWERYNNLGKKNMVSNIFRRDYTVKVWAYFNQAYKDLTKLENIIIQLLKWDDQSTVIEERTYKDEEL